MTEKQKMPYAAYDFGAEIYEGKIYSFFEVLTKKSSGLSYYSHGEVWTYDVDNDSWELINKIPMRQSSPTSILVNNKIYLIGSYDDKARNLVQVYNISNNEWEKSFKIPVGLYWTSVEKFKDKFYVMGGYSGYNKNIPGGSTFYNLLQIYDTKSEKWSVGKAAPQRMHSPNSLEFNNMFYVWDNYNNVFFKYNPIENKWSNLDKLKPFVKGSQEGIKYKDKLLFVSGTNNSSKNTKARKKIFSYDLKTREYVESFNNLSIGRHYGYGVFEHKNKIYILGGREEINWNSIDKVIELNVNN
ncbi:MAG: Kelch repeat-containing protein [Polaribacter sp.]